jgi:hypothetical protein
MNDMNNLIKIILAWGMPSSGMWRCVDLMWTDVSEERIAAIFRVEKSTSEEPTWAGSCMLLNAGSSLVDFYTLNMAAIRSSETIDIVCILLCIY